jgi:NAD(P)H-nitrite reductase large subunit
VKKRSGTIICRCMEITEEEIREAVRKGAVTVDAVKRATQAGFGLCQSKTCFNSVVRIIHEETGKPISELKPIKIRIPVRPVKVESLE